MSMPARIRPDNGAGFTATVIMQWLRDTNVGPAFIELGKPWLRMKQGTSFYSAGDEAQLFCIVHSIVAVPRAVRYPLEGWLCALPLRQSPGIPPESNQLAHVHLRMQCVLDIVGY